MLVYQRVFWTCIPKNNWIGSPNPIRTCSHLEYFLAWAEARNNKAMFSPRNWSGSATSPISAGLIFRGIVVLLRAKKNKKHIFLNRDRKHKELPTNQKLVRKSSPKPPNMGWAVWLDFFIAQTGIPNFPTLKTGIFPFLSSFLHKLRTGSLRKKCL